MRKSIDAHSPCHLPRCRAPGAAPSPALQGLGEAHLGSAEGGDSSTPGDLQVDCGGIGRLLAPRFVGGWEGKGCGRQWSCGGWTMWLVVEVLVG